ncbi:GNAT family N-acetyltransferase [Shewanella gaetbuli]|uniref:GNAT family N-acetyltransferase n=1 Tax=Shewanella gaetbuli TaxID=220752 RepID=A0A9X1ZQ58_9GAMM|nr:GNAT family N-acetyltransferase [Shewanella gaetbuli]MCL1143530.1 GNAT family N-acetyltransferase [Shewanella gaetbuli]
MIDNSPINVQFISIKTEDLAISAQLTYTNMSRYYARYGVDWDVSKILAQISHLDNWQILLQGEIVGALRLSFDAECCYLRDLQVSQQHQGKGVGGHALNYVAQFALASGVKRIELKVFKISPAYPLYCRYGFEVSDEDERFYYMTKPL